MWENIKEPQRKICTENSDLHKILKSICLVYVLAAHNSCCTIGLTWPLGQTVPSHIRMDRLDDSKLTESDLRTALPSLLPFFCAQIDILLNHVD